MLLRASEGLDIKSLLLPSQLLSMFKGSLMALLSGLCIKLSTVSHLICLDRTHLVIHRALLKELGVPSNLDYVVVSS